MTTLDAARKDAPPPALLVVDDEPGVRDSLSDWFRQESWEVVTAASADEALALAGRRRFPVALLDIRLPGMDGLELQKRLRQVDPSITIIVMTAYASVGSAVQAMKEGAYDYITKPFNPDEFTAVIRNALRDRSLLGTAAPEPPSVVAESPAMKRTIERLDGLAATEVSVFLKGEGGTGKELMGRRIHALSHRRAFHFVPVGCAGAEENALRRELFGHEKGGEAGFAFRRKGKIEMAHRGTLFLASIEEMPLPVQTDLVRVLEEGATSRLGSDEAIKVDLRIVAAGADDPAVLSSRDRLRRDLIDRLHSFVVELPPLRERREDIPRLADHFARQSARLMNRAVEEVGATALEKLADYDWPGNVRELRNVVERAVILAEGRAIEARHIMIPATRGGAESDNLSSLERVHIEAVLEETGGNMSQAARRLGIDRTTLYRKIDRYGIRRPGQDGA